MACLAQCAISARSNQPPLALSRSMPIHANGRVSDAYLALLSGSLLLSILDSTHHIATAIFQRDSSRQVETMLYFAWQLAVSILKQGVKSFIALSTIKRQDSLHLRQILCRKCSVSLPTGGVSA